MGENASDTLYVGSGAVCAGIDQWIRVVLQAAKGFLSGGKIDACQYIGNTATIFGIAVCGPYQCNGQEMVGDVCIIEGGQFRKDRKQRFADRYIVLFDEWGQRIE